MVQKGTSPEEWNAFCNEETRRKQRDKARWKLWEERYMESDEGSSPGDESMGEEMEAGSDAPLSSR